MWPSTKQWLIKPTGKYKTLCNNPTIHIISSNNMKLSSSAVLLLSASTASAGNLRNLAKRDLIAGNTRIIGGDEAVEDRYVYAVSLSDSYGHFCGGSLIAEDVVLSAAHCDPSGKGNYNAVVGRHGHDDTDGQELTVANALPHPDYDGGTTDNDFMLIFLKESANTTTTFVSLNSDATTPEVGANVTVMGWGDVDASNAQKLADDLMEVDVNVISNEECEKSDGEFGSYEDSITSNMLCAREEGGGEDSCQGDSGGPLIIKGASASEDIQVGVVSWGIGCASADYPGVYARVSAQYDWIKSEVCKGSKNPPSSFGCEDIINRSSDSTTQDAGSTSTPTPESSEDWRTIAIEDFTGNYGIFTSDKSNRATRYSRTKGKVGVVRMNSEDSTLKSNLIKVGKSGNKFKFTVDLYAINLTHEDSLCVDYQTSNSQRGENCWKALHDFAAFQWVTKSFEFDAPDAETVRFRLRVDSSSEENMSDVLISRVSIASST